LIAIPGLLPDRKWAKIQENLPIMARAFDFFI